MALKLDYVVRETSINMRRNITLTLAAIVTMGVSLSLVGCAMLMRFGVDNLSSRWEKGVEIILFLERDLPEEKLNAIETSLDDHPEVVTHRYVDQEDSRKEYERLFQRNRAMLERIEANPNILPTSFRVDPKTTNTEAIDSLTDQLGTEEGVMRATSSIEAIRTVESVSNSIQRAILFIAVGLLLAALLLILNAIRMAMFARRREIEVMKLVGATNWFIRVPFMLEGVVQGVLGSGLAVVSVYFLDQYMARVAQPKAQGGLQMLEGMVASSSETFGVIIAVVILGVVIGAAGSGWAVSRFLRV